MRSENPQRPFPKSLRAVSDWTFRHWPARLFGLLAVEVRVKGRVQERESQGELPPHKSCNNAGLWSTTSIGRPAAGITIRPKLIRRKPLKHDRTLTLRRPGRRQSEKRSRHLTVCIAAIAEGGRAIVLVADRAISMVRGEQTVFKATLGFARSENWQMIGRD